MNLFLPLCVTPYVMRRKCMVTHRLHVSSSSLGTTKSAFERKKTPWNDKKRFGTTRDNRNDIQLSPWAERRTPPYGSGRHFLPFWGLYKGFPAELWMTKKNGTRFCHVEKKRNDVFVMLSVAKHPVICWKSRPHTADGFILFYVKQFLNKKMAFFGIISRFRRFVFGVSYSAVAEVLFVCI